VQYKLNVTAASTDTPPQSGRGDLPIPAGAVWQYADMSAVYNANISTIFRAGQVGEHPKSKKKTPTPTPTPARNQRERTNSPSQPVTKPLIKPTGRPAAQHGHAHAHARSWHPTGAVPVPATKDVRRAHRDGRLVGLDLHLWPGRLKDILVVF
jgi:hypothetical protein